MGVSWECQEQLARQEAENDDDIRLSMRLFRNCLPDKKKFCPNVKPGHSQVKTCLEEHRNDPNFGKQCRVELEGMIERRVTDFRLDNRLQSVCKQDIQSICNFYSVRTLPGSRLPLELECNGIGIQCLWGISFLTQSSLNTM